MDQKPKPRYSKAEFAKRGQEIYERDVLENLEPGSHGRIAAIDVESGDFAIGNDTLAASASLRAAKPDAQLWFVRVGWPGVHRLGLSGSVKQG